MEYIHLISVDTNRRTIPKCVQNVPTLYVSKDVKYVGGDIYQWIHDINNVYTPNETKATHTKQLVPQEISSLDNNPSFSSAYTFLTEDGENAEFIEHKFTFINNNNTRIETLEVDTEKESKKCTSKDYEEYLKKRSLDMKRIRS